MRTVKFVVYEVERLLFVAEMPELRFVVGLYFAS